MTGEGYEFTPSGKPSLRSAIDTYLSNASQPTVENMQKAADIIGSAHREIEHTNDALSICTDLVIDVPDATSVLAEMISTKHKALPKRWSSDPEEARMALSMVGYIEVGYLRAQNTAVSRGPELPELSEKVTGIEKFLDDLQ